MARKTEKKFKLVIPQWAKPALKVVKKVAKPYVKALQSSKWGKAAAKVLPQVVSPVLKAYRNGSKKLPVTPKTVQPSKSEALNKQKSSGKKKEGLACNSIKPAESGKACQVPVQNNIKLSWEETFQKYNDGVLKGNTGCGALRSLALVSMPGLRLCNDALKLANIISLDSKVSEAKNYYNTIKESIKKDFNELGNQVYNSKTPFVSNYVGAFTNSSDFKKNGPLPLEGKKENLALALFNCLTHRAGGGILNYADLLTTYNSIKDNTNMASVLGAHMGGFVDGAVHMADGMVNICLDPNGTIEGILHMATNPQKTLHAIVQSFQTFSFHMVGAAPQEKARLEGRLLFEVASIICVLKIGKAAEGTKTIEKISQEASEASSIGKQGVSINQAEAKMAKASRSAEGAGVAGNLKPQGLLDELANSGVKYNPDDVVAVTKTADGKLVWLENGNSNAGLDHIMNHADDFATQGISKNEISNYVMDALENGKIVGYQGRGTGRPIYEFTYKGEVRKVAVMTGSNGFVVGANPVSTK
ncbi:hypothetical protein [Lacrimispora sp. JR3]|uniref:hypothetical protein n=1 Tax=Lacrimispora sinapis TaxID=3111456 RepID=UPI003748D634